MGMSEYKPDGKCGTCRHVRYVSGGGFHEPPYCDEECGVDEQLVAVENLLKGVADDVGDEDAYGEAAEWGVSQPCPLFLPWTTCATHGLLENPRSDYGCPTCTEEAEEALAAHHEEEAREVAELRKAGAL